MDRRNFFRRFWIGFGGGTALVQTGAIAAALAGPRRVDEAVDAPALVLAEVCPEDLDPADYWVSEKLDGVRAYWDGRQLRFRSGRPIAAPEGFVAGFPPTPLDGELWAGRGQFETVSGTVRKLTPDAAAWRTIRYYVFELPGAAGDFTARLQQLQTVVLHADLPWLQIVPQLRIAERTALLAKLEEIVASGGEGLMLHRADVPYVTGRSPHLLKLKPWQDAEAVVIGYQPGQGKYIGRVGALRVRTPAGVEFEVGTGLTDAERENPPSLGSTITYRYTGFTDRGIPRFARFWRRRAPE